MSKLLLRGLLRDKIQMQKPPEPKIYQCVDHFFPARSDLVVSICDFGEGRAERHGVRLGDIEAGEFLEEYPH